MSVLDRFRSVPPACRGALREALLADRTPRQVAGSFAIGTFVTVLPTLGVGLVLFGVAGRAVDWLDEVALYASALVFNPFVKPGVYVASVGLGILLLGPVEGSGTLGLADGPGGGLVVRLLVGNVVLAAAAALVGYAVVYRLAVRFRRSPAVEVLDDAAEDLAEVVVEP